MEAREKAHQLLCDIMIGNKYSNLLLRKELDDYDERDRALITRIVYGTMQNYRLVRYQWEHYVEKKISEDMAILMDMSLYQLMFLDIPSYALVNESVTIASHYHHGKYKNLINALLRRYLREGRRDLPKEPLEALGIETSHPYWLIAMWNKQYGFETTQKICLENQKIPSQACRVNTLKTTREHIIEKNDHFVKGLLSEDALIYDKGNIAQTLEYKEGLVTIQDESSQKVALFLDPKPHERILDVCAAPGTKTTHMAQLMQDSGEIIACDLHPHRVELIDHAVRRLNLSSIHSLCLDALDASQTFEPESFDRILVDAPCSGYGVLKRKNDIKVHMQSNDMDEIIPLQAQILESVSCLLKKEGILVYSTCTLNKKENEKQIEAFLKRHPEFCCLESITIFPFEYNSDGFFMAKLKKGGSL